MPYDLSETIAQDDELVRRVLDAVPARSYAMNALLSLVRIDVTRKVPTAAVSCDRRPVLMINPDFVAEHCRSDEHLFLLVMHELYHVLLGHTRLFPRPMSAWHDCVYLTQRANGTFTVKLHRQPIGEPGYAYLYCSRPFRTAKALLDALKKAEGESAYQSFEQDVDSMLDAVAELNVKLAMDALRLLAQRPWREWNPDAETRVLPTVQLD